MTTKKPLVLDVRGSATKAWSLNRLHSLWTKGRLDTDHYQRHYQDRKRKWNTRLVDSVAAGISIGEVVLVKHIIDDDDFKYYVVDGQHRLKTIMRFMDNEFKLSSSYLRYSDANRVGNRFWSQHPHVPATYQDKLDDRTINVYEFEESVDFTASEIFLTMNDGSSSNLKPMERFHAKHYNDEPYSILNDATNDREWLNHHNHIKGGNLMTREHTRRYLQHISDYHSFVVGHIELKTNYDFEFYDKVISSWDVATATKETKRVTDFLNLLGNVQGHGIDLFEVSGAKANPRRIIWVNVVLRHLISQNHGLSQLILRSKDIAEFMDSFSTHLEIDAPVTDDRRRTRIDCVAFQQMLVDCIRDLTTHLHANGLPVVQPPLTSKQRKEVLDDNRNESGLVVDAVTGAALPDHLVDVDHIHRRSDGGSNEKSNLRPVSKTLNRSQTLD